jgi:hypothetical protein
MWLVLHGRWWTSEWLQRHGLHNIGPCALCHQESETLDHFLVQCVYSRETWFKVLWRCGWEQLNPTSTYQVASWWISSRKWVPKHRRQAFDSLVLLVARHIWLERNDRVFRGECKQPTLLIKSLWEIAELWSRARLISWSQVSFIIPGRFVGSQPTCTPLLYLNIKCRCARSWKNA